MTFSVATSWLLPMNDRLHVKAGLDLSSAGSLEEAQAIAARLGAYLGTLPEYSLVDMMVRYPADQGMVRVVGAAVYGAEGEIISSPDTPTTVLPIGNLLVLDVDDTSLGSDDFVDGVGYCIPARDVRHAVVRVVPDMTEIKTQDDLDHYMEEYQAIVEKLDYQMYLIGHDMPDGSLLDVLQPGGSPDPDSGALVDYRVGYIAYGGQGHRLPSKTEFVPPHLPGQDDGGDDSGGDDSGGGGDIAQ